MKATTYSTLVWPSLEFATMAWDPHQQYLINSIEMVQRRAARWVKQEYSMTTSVTAILNNLEWNILSKRRQFSRLTIFFKFLHQDPPVTRIPQHFLPTTLTHYTWHNHHLHYIPPSTSTTVSSQDNYWLDNIIESDTLQHFILSLKSHDFNWHSGLDPINIITL